MLFRCFFACAAVLFSVLALTAEDSTYSPDIKSASNEGELAMEGFVYPDDMQIKLWAAEPKLANPVAFGIDEQGRIYVCETFRQSKGVEDNRGHMDWLADDLSLNSVEERAEMFKKFLGDDVVKYSAEQDRIRLLEDTDGDGKADKSTIFADGFNDIVDGTGAGVLAINGDVYYTCIPKLYKMRDDNGDGKADEIEALHHGYGVRVAFRGHDMHGLIIGPDGRLYFSIGDRGYNVMTKEGAHLFRPDTGAVFRCELDGSNLEVFAYGLRNPQELAFDDYGNLFTGDNNSDSGDQARWVYVTEGSDTGWRMYFQYLSDRGPWNRERMWYPYRADEQTSEVQPAYIMPPILNISDGPSGLVHYPGVGLSPKFEDHFFLADFRGSAGQSGIRNFRVEPKGATFELVDDDWFMKSALITDVDFGYDGRMYISDWVDGWNGPGKGRIYSLTNQQYRLPSIQEPSEEIIRRDFSQITKKDLAELLQHPDYRIRQRAQFQLVENQAADVLTAVAKDGESLKTRLHAVWGLGQLLRRDQLNPGVLIPLVDDEDAEVRAQSLKVLADANSEKSYDLFIEAVKNGSPREQYFAAIGLGKLGNFKARHSILEMLTANDNKDPALRHAGIMGLAGVSSEESLAELSSVEFPQPVRLAAVVALRMSESPLLTEFLNDPEIDVVVEAARAIHDLNITQAIPTLAELRITADSPDALIRRVLSANYRLGKEENAERAASIAADKNFPESIRREAMEELLLWDQPPVFDRVTGIHHPLEKRPLKMATAAVRRNLGGMITSESDLKTQAIKLAAKYRVRDVEKYLKQILAATDNDPQMRVEALVALDSADADGLDRLLKRATQDASDQLRARARTLLAKRNPEAAVPQLAIALKDGTRIERQSAVEALAAMDLKESNAVLLAALDQYVAGEIAPEIQLDLLQVAEQRMTPEFQQRLEQIEANRDANDPLAAYRECLQGGSVERGIEIFFGNAAASCRRCHKVKGDGSDVGPDLSAVSKENPREYLLESIVDPNAKIAKGFETVVFATIDGRIVSGIIKGETDTTYRLMKPMGEIVVIEKEDIDAQAKGKSGMPADMAKQLTKSEIRDLVEYLSTLKTPYQPEGHE